MSELNSLGFNNLWHDKKVEDYSNDLKAKDKVIAYLNSFSRETNYGLYLHGKNGVGKSYLANSLCISLIYKKVLCRATTFPDLVQTYVNSWRSEEDREILNKYLSCRVLLIEEIGKEYNTSRQANENFVNTCLDMVLKHRLQNKFVTLFTSNVDPTDLKGLYTIDIASMLREIAVPIQVMGSDYRSTIQLANKKLLEI